MEFWGVQVKPKKSRRVSRTDYGGSRLHVTQATLGSNVSKERSIVKCRVGDGPVVYLCSLLPGVMETCSLDLYFEDDIVFSVKGPSSVHLVGYFEPFYDEDEPGEDVGYSDEDNESEDDDSLDGFVVDDDSGDEEFDFEADTTDEEEPILIPNSGVKIEELKDDEGQEKRDSEKITSIVPVKTDKETLETKENVANGEIHSSEDEDGFPVDKKRKREDEDVQSTKKRPCESEPASEPAPAITPTKDVETPGKTSEEETPKKKKKNKKKKKKEGKEEEQKTSEDVAAKENNGKLETKDDAQALGKKGTVKKYPNGLEVVNVSMGTPDGRQATRGKKVGMTYIGRLKSNGKIFDSNVGKKPFFFRLGVGEVIKGWDIGVNGMRVGDKRKLTIPPSMGYGSKSIPGIPGNSWLVFDVELVEVK